MGFNKPKTRQSRKTGSFFVSLRQALRPLPPTRKMLAHLHFTDHDYPTTSNLPPPPAISLCLQPSGVALRHQEPPPVAGERARQEQTNVDKDKQPANLQELAGCFDILNAHFGALTALSGCRKFIKTGDALR